MLSCNVSSDMRIPPDHFAYLLYHSRNSANFEGQELHLHVTSGLWLPPAGRGGAWFPVFPVRAGRSGGGVLFRGGPKEVQAQQKSIAALCRLGRYSFAQTSFCCGHIS